MLDTANMPHHRGRPKGSGIDDEAHLRAIAEHLDSAPGISLAAAIDAVLCTAYPDDASLRSLNVRRESIAHRLRGKWRSMRAHLLEDVQARKRAERAERAARAAANFLAGIATFQRYLGLVAKRARPWIEMTVRDLDAALRTLEAQKILTFAERVQALQKDPKLAVWLKPNALAVRR